MKVFFAVLFVALVAGAVALTDEQKEKFKGYSNECVASTSVDKALIEKMRAGDYSEDAKLKSYVHCMFDKLGFINAAGELQIDAIKAKIPSDVDPAAAMKVIDACKDTKAAKPEETAYEAYKCYRSKTTKVITV